MDLQFIYADKNRLDEILPSLFEILHNNMNVIAPTGNSYEDDFSLWFSNVRPAMEKEARKIVLMYADGVLTGYFQYYVNGGTFMMEEIQIKREFHGTGTFSAFYSWLVGQLPVGIEYVEAYAHKNNRKSQGILEHLGLDRTENCGNGNSYHYKGSYKSLYDKYSLKGMSTKK